MTTSENLFGLQTLFLLPIRCPSSSLKTCERPWHSRHLANLALRSVEQGSPGFPLTEMGAIGKEDEERHAVDVYYVNSCPSVSYVQQWCPGSAPRLQDRSNLRIPP